MLKAILDRHVLFILMGVFTAFGIVSKCIAGITLKKLVQAAGNMNKSTHPLIRLVRAKYEHACMINDKVQNVGAFVDKYLYEYKVAGLRLYKWRRMENVMAGLCFITGTVAAFLTYSVYGMSDDVLKSGAYGAILAILLFLFHLTSDENYMLKAIRNYMVDYLENVCARRYEKNYQKEIQIASAREERPTEEMMPDNLVTENDKPEKKSGAGGDYIEMPQKDIPEVVMPPEKEPDRPAKPEIAKASVKKEKEEKTEQKPVSKEVLIREILEEFLA